MYDTHVCRRLVCAAMLLVCCGCSQSAAPGVAGGGKPAEAGPKEAVFEFLDAVRTGNDEAAAGLLTRKALEKTREMELAVAPEGSDTAQFTVGEVEHLPDNIAHVASTWTDEGDTQNLIWALRKEPEGWRVAGMVMKLFEGEPPLVLNFEDPEDMLKQQEMAYQEMQRRMAASAGSEPEGKEPADKAGPSASSQRQRKQIR